MLFASYVFVCVFTDFLQRKVSSNNRIAIFFAEIISVFKILSSFQTRCKGEIDIISVRNMHIFAEYKAHEGNLYIVGKKIYWRLRFYLDT